MSNRAKTKEELREHIDWLEAGHAALLDQVTELKRQLEDRPSNGVTRIEWLYSTRQNLRIEVINENLIKLKT